MKLTPLTFQNTKEFVGWMKKVSISMPIAKMSSYSSVPNNRVYQIIVFKGNLQLTCQRVVPNNRVERIFPTLGQKQMFFYHFICSIKSIKICNKYFTFNQTQRYNLSEIYYWDSMDKIVQCMDRGP